MPLPISRIVDVQIERRGGAAARTRFGQILALTTDNPNFALSYAGSNKVRSFASLRDLTDAFGSSGQAYRIASAAFAQTPAPPIIHIGSRAPSDQPHRIIGGEPEPAADIASSNVSDGSLTLGSTAVSGISFSSGASYADIAAAVQTRAAAAITGATCSYADGVFTITVPNSETVSGPATAGSAGTDLAADLGLTAAAGARFSEGADQETVAEALAAIQLQSDAWHAIVSESGEDGLAAAAWAAGSGKFAWVQDSDAGALTANEGTSVLARLFAGGSSRASGTWHSRPATEENVAVCAAARFAAVDYNRPRSAIQGKFLSFAGVSGADITAAQKDELERKRTNVYALYGSISLYGEGTTPSTDETGAWVDVVYFLDWLQSEIELAIVDFLRVNPRASQTDATSAALKDALAAPLRKGRDAGGIAPGLVSPDVAARIRALSPDFDGRLSAGYLVSIAPFDTLSAADRQNRRMPPVSVFVKGSGAINFVDAALVFNA